MYILDFLRHRRRAGRHVRGIAQHLRKLVADFDDVVVAAFHGFRGDDVERIVDKVWIDLRLQGIQLGLQRSFAQRHFVRGAFVQARHQVVEHLFQLVRFTVAGRSDVGKQLIELNRFWMHHAGVGNLPQLARQFADGAGQPHRHEHNQRACHRQNQQRAAEKIDSLLCIRIGDDIPVRTDVEMQRERRNVRMQHGSAFAIAQCNGCKRIFRHIV